MNLSIKEQLSILKKNKLIHSNWYKSQYPDVEILGMDAAQHYIKYGAMLGRNPGRHFNTQYYLEMYEDARESGMNPLLHYALHGKKDGRFTTREQSEIHRVKQLRRQLWGGLSDHATQGLEEILAAGNLSPSAAYEAMCFLAVWYDFVGREDDAVKLLEQAAPFAAALGRSPRCLIPLSILYARRGEVSKARLTLRHLEEKNSNYTLGMANLKAGQEKLDLINQIYSDHGVATLTIRDPDAPLSLMNLDAEGPTCEFDIGKVSIIMPAYASESVIGAAIRSIQRQTYENFELLVVDDCSPDGTYELVVQMAKEDRRIIPLKSLHNAGAYPARNIGLRHATGDFITTHDADDWSHPQKVELQLRELQADPNTVAVMAQWVRALDDLTFTTNWRLSERILHASQSSFLIRRTASDKLGVWDEVRIAADSEYIWRAEAMYGKEAIKECVPELPLAFALDNESSLTRTKLTHVSTNFFGLRHYYRQVCRYWLQRCPQGLTHQENATKMSMIPPEMFSRPQPTPEFEVLLIGDCSRRDVVQKMIAIAEEQSPAFVGITHMPDANSAAQAFDELRFADVFFDLMQKANVQIVLPGKAITVKDTVDLNAPPLAFAIEG